jgi:hypothetical protein
MVARWIWSIQGASGRPGYRCHIVSQDIPFDVGWSTYTIDLFDAFQGSGEEWVGDCPSGKLTWQNSSPVLEMRFDPNENVTIDVLHQDLDWIRLTEEEHVKQGQPFTVQIGFNKPPDEVRQKTFYYTDNLQDPTQHLAKDYSSQASSTTGAKPSASYYTSRAFLPLLSQQTGGAQGPILLADGINFQWNTKTVAPGEYYICTVVEDDYNQATYCSQAPVRVDSP